MNTTYVYAATVDALSDAAVFEKALASVSKERREKVARLHRDIDKRLSLGAELLLTYALAQQGITAYTVERDENGKPFLDSHPHVQFNLSHSGNTVLCAVSSYPVGCDVQTVLFPAAAVIKRTLTDAEQGRLYARPTDADKARYFTRLWTIKESVLKAIGHGLKAGMNTVECLIDDTPTQTEIRINDETFHVSELMSDEVCAAVCVRGESEIIFQIAGI